MVNQNDSHVFVIKQSELNLRVTMLNGHLISKVRKTSENGYVE